MDQEQKQHDFLSRVNKHSGVFVRDLTECWRWTGSFDDGGYGKIQTNWSKEMKETKAHRMSYKLFNGEVPPGRKNQVLHACDNPWCVNPAHLTLGDQAKNNKERDERGRHKPLKGDANGRAKPPTQEELALLKEMIASNTPRRVMSEKIGHARTWIDRIVRDYLNSV